jgi:hypothetical protein
MPANQAEIDALVTQCMEAWWAACGEWTGIEPGTEDEYGVDPYEFVNTDWNRPEDVAEAVRTVASRVASRTKLQRRDFGIHEPGVPSCLREMGTAIGQCLSDARTAIDRWSRDAKFASEDAKSAYDHMQNARWGDARDCANAAEFWESRCKGTAPTWGEFATLVRRLAEVANA